ncbi:GLPGLI family protein [Chryseobacterium caseinilyticum]|uniref:GLPGLI family protein n=1 Tax=Chryseobacterium caseinilyticum TaxID=2771428 RepID=A0ABR8ZEM4_9FLAO|nr:GLPGLI family protein [Chryseobacterium caseinilyticum]MBD8083707.1 GLPGLI family protein [Chryseobacterium caseinilyticum]
MLQKTILLSTILISIFSLAQNTKASMQITYQMNLISDSLQREKVKTAEFILLCNTTESVFYTKEAKDYYDNESGKKGSSTLNLINSSVGAIPRFPKHRESVHRNEGKTIVNTDVGKYIFTYEEPDLKWEILSQKKDILGYTCRLASAITDTNDTFFVWFAEDISIPDGPFRFKGLSGLVLEVYNTNRTIKFTAVGITKSEETIEPITYPNKIMTKNKEQYLEARKNYHANPSAYNGNLRIFDASGKETTYKMHERLKKINVFLD